MTGERWFTPWRTACILLVAFSGFAFAASLPGQAIWDDIPLINGSGIGGGKSLLHVFTRPFLDNYFRPLVSLSFYLERPLWGSGPFGYHQTNLIIHALNTALMISLLLAAFRCRRIAFAGATIFAFHPVHVSSVAWIGGRTDPMLCLFMTCSALCLIRSAQAEGGAWRRTLGWAAWWYFLALLCKEQVLVLLPLAPLAYRFFGERTWDGARKRQSKKAAYAFSAVAAFFIVCWFLAAPPKHSVMAGGLVSHLEQAGQTFFAYCGLLLAPNATWMHTFTIGPTEGFGWFGAACGYLFVVGLIAFIVKAWRRSSQLAWWALWSLLVLLPVSNLLPIATLLVAPYRAEIAQIGIAAIGGWAAVGVWDRFRFPAVRYSLAFSGAFATAWCLHLCVWGSAKWMNSETIFRQICAVDPDCIFARETVAQSLLNKRKYAEAGKEIEELLERILPNGRWRDVDKVVLEMHGDSPISQKLRHNQGGTIDPNVWLSHIYAQLGSLRVRQGEPGEAETYLKAAVTLDASCYDGLIELGFLALRRGEFAHARFWASRAIGRAPTVADGYAVRGRAHAALGKTREAQADFERCVALQPWAGQAYIELAETQVKLGDRQGAVATLSEALRRSPRRDDIRKRLAAL
jgi:tetratricopeptide (TPR) repeat protein